MCAEKMNQIRHKCGCCGWLFKFTTNFAEHECFKDYVEDIDHINIDDNYVVTIVRNNSTLNKKENLNKLLIETVRSKPGLYDHRVPASGRTMLRKKALWAEVSNILQGFLSPDEAKARWKYLRNNYTKARKKIRAYVPSGSSANANDNKSKFQYYKLMTFLNDSLQTRPTVSSLTDANAKNDKVISIDIENEQHEDADIGIPSNHQQPNVYSSDFDRSNKLPSFYNDFNNFGEIINIMQL